MEEGNLTASVKLPMEAPHPENLAPKGNLTVEEQHVRTASLLSAKAEEVLDVEAERVEAKNPGNGIGVGKLTAVEATANGVSNSDGGGASDDIVMLEEGVIQRAGNSEIYENVDRSEASAGGEVSVNGIRQRKAIPKIYEDVWKLCSDDDADTRDSAHKRCCMPREEDSDEVSGCRKLCHSVVGKCYHLVTFNNKICCCKRMPWTRNLQKARGFALRKVGLRVTFPLFHDCVRMIWVTIEFALALFGLALSIATISLDHNEIFNLLHLALSITSFILSVLDIFYTMKWRSCRCSCNRAEEYVVTNNTCGKKCYYHVKIIADILRAVVSEMIVYPILMCNILGVITNKSYEANSILKVVSFILFILSSFFLILYVYVVRILVMLRTITGRSSFNRYKQVCLNQPESSDNPTLRKSSCCYQIWFFMNMVFLMIIQILMIIAIGARMFAENLHFYEDGNKNMEVRITPYLWYMMACGYIAPFVGFLSYLLITMPWANDFVLGIFYDFISVVKFFTKGNRDNFIPGVDEMPVPSEWKENLNKFFKSFVDNFEEYRYTKFCRKVAYPFTTFIVFPPCVLYFWLQIFFVVGAGNLLFDYDFIFGEGNLFFSYNSEADVGSWIYDLGWKYAVFCLFAIPFAGLLSAHIMTVGFMWSWMLSSFIAVSIPGLIFFSFLLLYNISKYLFYSINNRLSWIWSN